MLLQDRCYLFYKNVKRKSFSDDAGIRGKNRAKQSSPLLSSSELVPAASAFELEFCTVSLVSH